MYLCNTTNYIILLLNSDHSNYHDMIDIIDLKNFVK